MKRLFPHVSLIGIFFLGLVYPVSSLFALSRSPATINFPNTPVGNTSAPIEGRLLRGSTVLAVVTSVSITGSSSFTIAPGGDQCTGKTLASPVNNCSVFVVFTPSNTVAQSGVLQFNTTAGNQTINLTGTGTSPTITFSAPSFSTTNVGSTDTKSITITNVGASNYDVANVTLSGTNSSLFQISQNNCNAHVLAPGGGFCTVSVTFSPSSGGSFSANLNVLSQTLSSASLAFSALATNPNLSISTPSFNSTDIGGADTQTFTLTNNGNGVLQVASLLLSGVDVGVFGISEDNCSGLSLAASGGTCTVNITFRPAWVGTVDGTLNVQSSNAAGNSAAFSAEGFDALLTFSPVIFGVIDVGSSELQTITVTNFGNSTYAVNGVSLSGTNPSQFFISQDHCTGQNLIAGGLGSCTLELGFHPLAAGSFTTNLNVVSATALASNALNATATNMDIGFASTAYTSVEVGQSQTRTFTLTNQGNSNYFIQSLSLSGLNPEQFSVSNDLCTLQTLSSGGTCTVNVIFHPEAPAVFNAILNVHNPVAGSAATALSATGIQAGASPDQSALNFGPQASGSQSPLRSITLTNTGSGTLHVQLIYITGANVNEYQITSDLCTGLSVSSGGTCTFSVRFLPNALGIASATARILSDAGSGSNFVNLLGLGVVPGTAVVNLSATSLSFAPQTTGSPAGAQTVTLTNTGTEALNVSAVFLSGINAGDFSITQDSCSGKVIAAGASCVFSVDFTASNTSTENAVVNIVSNSPTALKEVSLSGVVTPPNPSVTPIIPGDSSRNIQGAVGGSCALGEGRQPETFACCLEIALLIFAAGIVRKRILTHRKIATSWAFRRNFSQ